jgi:chromosome segregation ATPase
MASTSLTFRCPDEVLEAIDNLGKERYPAANTKHGCDRSKTLIDIMRAGIEALSDGSVVLPAPAEVRQQPSYVRQILSDSSLEARITEIVQRQTEPLFAEKFSALEERLGKLSAANDGGGDESLRQQLKQTEEHLAEVTRDRDELKQQLATLTAFRAQLAAELASRQQLQAELVSTREELALLKENPPTDNTQQPAVELKLPSPADLLNQLKKANGKKFTANLTDVEKILESLGGEES